MISVNKYAHSEYFKKSYINIIISIKISLYQSRKKIPNYEQIKL